MKEAIASTHGDRLYINSRVAVGDLLPIAMLQRLRAVPGVRAVTPRRVLVGTYMKPGQIVPAMAVDARALFRIYPELRISTPGALQALQSTRTGALIGSELATRYGWKIGDHIALQSSVARRDGARAWEFDVVGVFSEPQQAFGVPPPRIMIVNFAYVNDARATDVDRADVYLATINDATRAGAVSLAIDNTFANSDHETYTQSEGDFMRTALQRTVDLGFIVHPDCLAAVQRPRGLDQRIGRQAQRDTAPARGGHRLGARHRAAWRPDAGAACRAAASRDRAARQLSPSTPHRCPQRRALPTIGACFTSSCISPTSRGTLATSSVCAPTAAAACT
jgi:hypothetical protein